MLSVPLEIYFKIYLSESSFFCHDIQSGQMQSDGQQDETSLACLPKPGWTGR